MIAGSGAGPGMAGWPCTASDLDAAAAWVRAMRRGDFEAAWAIADREAACRRMTDPSAWRRQPQRIWDGRPIDGRRVRVHCGRGLRDAIQFARFLPALAARAGGVFVCAPPELLPLLATMAAPVEYVPFHDDAPDRAAGADGSVDVEIAELPWLLRCTIATLPARVPYLHVDPRPRVYGDDRLTIGVSWSGGEPDRTGGISATLLAPIAQVPGVRAVALTAGPTPADPAAWTGDRPPLDSLATLAGEIAALDLVISPDTTCAHLAGALGVPVWTLLEYEADWRWMEDRDDSPWYPTMRLFRQPAPRRWDAVVAQVLAACGTAVRSLPVRPGAVRQGAASAST
jgi:hypothetical protein